MPIGDFGSFGNWSPKDHALNKMVYDEAHKNGGGSGGSGGGNGNSGCSILFMIVVVAVVFWLIWR